MDVERLAFTPVPNRGRTPVHKHTDTNGHCEFFPPIDIGGMLAEHMRA